MGKSQNGEAHISQTQDILAVRNFLLNRSKAISWRDFYLAIKRNASGARKVWKVLGGYWRWATVERVVGAESVKPSLTFIQEDEELQQEIGGIVPPIQKEQDFQRC